MSDVPDRASMPDIRLSYLLCATPRTGSNILCEALRATRVVGGPDDYFWSPPVWYERWQVSSFPAYLARLLEEGTGPNGVFGCKMMWHYVDELVPRLAD
jgi:LPS sulfotransferase NodH